MENLESLLALLFTKIEDIDDLSKRAKNALLNATYEVEENIVEEVVYVGDLIDISNALSKIEGVGEVLFKEISEYTYYLRSAIPDDVTIDWVDIKSLYDLTFYDYPPTEKTFKEFTERLAFKEIDNVKILFVFDNIGSAYLLKKIMELKNSCLTYDDLSLLRDKFSCTEKAMQKKIDNLQDKIDNLQDKIDNLQEKIYHPEKEDKSGCLFGLTIILSWISWMVYLIKDQLQ